MNLNEPNQQSAAGEVPEDLNNNEAESQNEIETGGSFKEKSGDKSFKNNAATARSQYRETFAQSKHNEDAVVPAQKRGIRM